MKTVKYNEKRIFQIMDHSQRVEKKLPFMISWNVFIKILSRFGWKKSAVVVTFVSLALTVFADISCRLAKEACTITNERSRREILDCVPLPWKFEDEFQ